jgi:AAA family ATP:ADP antiporter
MLLSALVLLACILASHIANRREARGQGAKIQAAREPLRKEGGFRLISKSRYLALIAALIVLLNVVNTTGGFIMNSLVEQEAVRVAGAGEQAQAAREKVNRAFFSSFYGWQNMLGLLIQMFLVSRIFKYVGVRGAIFVLPSIALSGYSIMAFAPVLGLVRITKLLENATDYSLQNTIRGALYLPTSREAKYSAKAAIDTFFVRTGDALQALLVYGGTTAGLAVAGFATMNVFFVLLWLGMAVAIFKEHKKLTREA